MKYVSWFFGVVSVILLGITLSVAGDSPHITYWPVENEATGQNEYYLCSVVPSMPEGEYQSSPVCQVAVQQHSTQVLIYVIATASSVIITVVTAVQAAMYGHLRRFASGRKRV